MRGRRRERLRVESRVHDTNLRSVGEQNRCQVGPTILFECPAQIPRSFLRSFSLWARHSAFELQSPRANSRTLVLAFAPKGAVVMDPASVFRYILDILWDRNCLWRTRGFIHCS